MSFFDIDSIPLKRYIFCWKLWLYCNVGMLLRNSYCRFHYTYGGHVWLQNLYYHVVDPFGLMFVI